MRIITLTLALLLAGCATSPTGSPVRATVNFGPQSP